AVLGEDVVLLPAEHVAVERRDRGPAGGVERLGGHRHRNVVEPGQPAFRLGHELAPGATRTLAATRPPARPRIASSMPSRGTSTGSMSSATGMRPDTSRSSA